MVGGGSSGEENGEEEGEEEDREGEGGRRGKEKERTERNRKSQSSFGVGQAVGGLSGRGSGFPTPALCTQLQAPLGFSLTNVPRLVLNPPSPLHNICPKGKIFSNCHYCPHTVGGGVLH